MEVYNDSCVLYKDLLKIKDGLKGYKKPLLVHTLLKSNGID